MVKFRLGIPQAYGGLKKGGAMRKRQQVSWEEIARVAEELDTECRALLSADPALGLGRIGDYPEFGIANADTTEQTPVMLFEPRTTIVMQGPRGERLEGQVESIIQGGLRRFTAGLAVVEIADGWTLRRIADGVELLDAGDGLWARGHVGLEPTWISAAVSHRYALVLYGIQLGVRVPPGRNPGTYGAAERRQKLPRARRVGVVAAGLVRWIGHGEQMS